MTRLRKDVIKNGKLLLCMFVIIGLVVGCGSGTNGTQNVEMNSSSVIQESQTEEQMVDTETEEISENDTETLDFPTERKFVYQSITPHYCREENLYWLYGDRVFDFAKGRKASPFDDTVNMDSSMVIISNLSFENGYNNSYYQIKNNQKELIDEGMELVQVAIKSKKITYRNDQDQVILCDVSSGEKIVIAEYEPIYETYSDGSLVCTAEVRPLVISPDGNTVVYEFGNDFYVYTNGKEYEFESNISNVFAVSDSAEYIYYEKEDTLYVCVDMNEHKKIVDNFVMWSGNLIFNEGYTQLLVGSIDGWYIVKEGGEIEKLIDGNQKLSMIVPEYVFTDISGEYEIWDSELGIYTYASPCIMCGTDSLLNQFYYSEDGTLFYFSKTGEVIRVEENLRDAQISKSGRYVYYIKNDELYYRIDSKLSMPVLVADNVSTFIIQSENEIYYKDMSNALFYKKGTDEAQLIANNVYFEVLTYDDYVLFLTDYSNNSGTLNCSKNGSNKTFIAENVYSVTTSGGATYYCANYHKETSDLGEENFLDVYVITENMGAKLLLEDMPCYSDGIAIYK